MFQEGERQQYRSYVFEHGLEIVNIVVQHHRSRR